MRTRRAVLVLALLAAAPARAGHVVEMTIGADGDRTSKLQVEGKRWRIDNSASKTQGKRGRAEFFIFDAETQTFTFVRPDEKTYVKVDQARIDAQMAAVRAQMKERLAKLPPEQRKRAEEAMKSSMEGVKLPAVHYERTARTGNAAGHRCVFYRETMEGEPDRAEVCIAPFDDVGVRKEDFQALFEWKGFAGARRGSDASNVWTKSPGVPLIRERKGADGKLHEDMRVTSLKRASIPADAFRVPAGFTEKKAFAD